MKTILRWLNIALVIFTLLVYLVSPADPTKFWPAAFLGLFWPFLFFFNLGFVLLWAYKKKWYGLISAMCLLAFWPSFNKVISFNPGNSKEKEGVSILSYNVQYFSSLSGQDDIGEVLKDYTKEEEVVADIYCFQEGRNADWKSIADKLGMKKRWIGNGGNTVILSRYDVVGKGELEFEKSHNSCVYLDLDINGKTVRVYNAHLQSNKISKDTREVVSENKYSDKKLIRGIFSKYKAAVIRRADQVKELREHIDSCPYPVLVCGDFNDQPMSFVYKRLMDSDRLRYGFIDEGFGIGSTYNGNIPCLRIDYILSDKSFEQLEYRRIKETFSDHFAIFSKIQID